MGSYEGIRCWCLKFGRPTLEICGEIMPGVGLETPKPTWTYYAQSDEFHRDGKPTIRPCDSIQVDASFKLLELHRTQSGKLLRVGDL